MNPILLQQFIQLIARYTGLHIREQDYNSFCNKIFVRIKLLKLSSPEEYYQLLENQNQISKNEWEKLIILLTVTETYFFRDQGQLGLLKNVILPKIIKSKIASNQKQLKIWSAGCSTGEEPYSLAIIVQELIPNWKEWNILILGTDINEVALTKAEKGIYNSWSFRLIDRKIKQKYFYEFQGEWQLDEKVKKVVNFRNINLVQDNFPNDIDLILCRNVFVYFELKQISLVMQKFYNCLVNGGYLITGHAELYGQSLGQFQVKVFPESLVYQRDENWQNKKSLADGLPRFSSHNIPSNQSVRYSSTSKPSNYSIVANASQLKEEKKSRKTTEKKISKSENLLLEAEKLFERKNYLGAIKKAEDFIAVNPKNFRGYKLLAELYANVGKYERATFCCNQAIEINSASVEPYYLLVNIAEEEGNIEKAKVLLKRVLYLWPVEIPAYLELSSLYAAQQDIIRSKKMKNIALELLKKLPADDIIQYKGGIKVSELIKYL
ncbi:MAG: CheR family methyltransferase [Trichodesmium sp.]